MAKQEQKVKQKTTLSFEETMALPAVALRGIVIFPNDVIHFDVGRPMSIAAMEMAMRGNRHVFLVAQKDMAVEEPVQKDLYDIGVVVRIRQMLKNADDSVRVLVEGLSRAKLCHFDMVGETSFATVSLLKEKTSRAKTAYKEALMRRVQESFAKFTAFTPKMPKDIKNAVLTAQDPTFLGDYIAANLPIPLDDKQYVLEQLNPIKRLEVVLDILHRELEICEMDASIHEKTHQRIEENQREYYLREQLRAIQDELYGEADPDQEIAEYNRRIEASAAADAVKKLLRDEVRKLSKMPPGSHEATVVRVYLDTCLDLPFSVQTKLSHDVKKAEKILNKEHYGLQKVKEQILETIAVFALKPDAKGHILCLAGPPGVGKTSIGKSLAKCMGRSFARISLGGIHDEAEIRGHRKTYIGSMPGKIIKAVTAAGSTNALLLLDEIDKLAADYKGDPASALLEVLDAEQNATFQDHYLDFPFDLSDIFFVTTANNIENIPAPLLDRMDVIELTGYTREDKFQIAKRHLLAKQMKKHGLTAKNFRIDDAVLFGLIDYYTREAGVRLLERRIASLCRKAAKKLAEGSSKRVHITEKNLSAFLGKHKYNPEEILPQNEVGIINGLAWTAVGGELMQMEVLAVEGSGKIELTGSLGDVMKESAQAAVTYVRSHAEEYGIAPDFYKNTDIHIHATEAAVPKDGPSAGVTMVTALISALAGWPVKNTVAMTGEITIRGRVLPIGGLKEKAMAAYRAGVKTVFIPEKNLPDLEEVDDIVKASLEFVPAGRVEDILARALEWPQTESTESLPRPRYPKTVSTAPRV